jgi:hypothetical protein
MKNKQSTGGEAGVSNLSTSLLARFEAHGPPQTPDSACSTHGIGYNHCENPVTVSRRDATRLPVGGSRKYRVGNFENDAGRHWKGDTLAKPSYGYEKRRKEQAKKKKKEAKQEEKRLRKLAANAPPAEEAPEEAPGEAPGEVIEDS